MKNLRLSSVETASHAPVVYDEHGWMGSMCGTAETPRVTFTFFSFSFCFFFKFRQREENAELSSELL